MDWQLHRQTLSAGHSAQRGTIAVTVIKRSSIHFLENESVEIGGVRFLGTTLWTDYRLEIDHMTCLISTTSWNSTIGPSNASPGLCSTSSHFKQPKPSLLASNSCT